MYRIINLPELESPKLQHLVSPALSSLTIPELLQKVLYIVRHKRCLGFFCAIEQEHLWPKSQSVGPAGAHPLQLKSPRNSAISEKRKGLGD